MRNLDRLIEVVYSINDHIYQHERHAMVNAVMHLEDDDRLCEGCEYNVGNLSRMHPSPHIRELAAEIIHYGGFETANIH
jgi:hypothetical protein